MEQAARPRLHYAWIAAGVTFVVLLAAAGARATPGVILLPFGNEFQWSRAKVSSIVSINIFLYGLIGPFAAALYQRFGLRRTMAAAMVLLAAGYGLSTVVTAYWQFVLLWGFVVGAGSGMAATVLGAAVATRWFTEKRGLVMGVLTATYNPSGRSFVHWAAAGTAPLSLRIAVGSILLAALAYFYRLTVRALGPIGAVMLALALCQSYLCTPAAALEAEWGRAVT